MLAQPSTIFTKNGYLIIDITNGIEENYWETTIPGKSFADRKKINDNQQEHSDEEGNEGQTYDMFQQVVNRVNLTKKITRLTSLGKEKFNQYYIDNLRILKSEKKNCLLDCGHCLAYNVLVL